MIELREHYLERMRKALEKSVIELGYAMHIVTELIEDERGMKEED